MRGDHTGPVVRRLYSDAGSGILFALAGQIEVDQAGLPHGVIMCPVAKASGEVRLYPGARLASVRFHPATAYGVLGQHYEGLTRLAPADDLKAVRRVKCQTVRCCHPACRATHH